MVEYVQCFFFFSSRRRHTRFDCDWSSDVCSSDLGFAAASAGDVNGDGYDDVIVGAPTYDEGLVDAGKVWVYHGSPSGLLASAGATVKIGRASCRERV